ncbi:MAG TPA: MetQ/NlpA family ABC transporter substrate-binding protein [Spirochaetales bacterium]|nr:MetQ/NlpA family ABC transporter substrate-binding protein [Spirochaetales bacterium]HRY55913.1 MetQ/NlpA family ABC transporter substrate-binding protein [Spirochaetia bacterium]HRZ63774.1 MetQ/NlpA family ABC transporter substrate-binding protein [Spirochaetia bacterium]
MRSRNVVLAAAALAALAAAPLAAAPAGARELRIAVLPDADSLPLLVAEAEGLFAAEGVAVRLLPFKAAVERDAALQSGAVDGAVADLLAAALAAQAGFQLRVASLTDGRYGIVAAPGSGISKPADLAGVPIGISTNTVIQYAVDSLLSRAGLPASSIQGLAVPNIQLRMELLLSGKLKAACLPEPLLTVAKAKGAVLVAASDDAGLGAGVLMFPASVLDSRLAEVAAFYRAYAKAAERINADTARYRPFLVEKAGFPAEARESFAFVRYAKPRLPSERDLASALDWMRAKGILTRDLDPASLLDARAIEAAR